MIRKLSIGLFIFDVHYLQHLLDYVRNSEFAERFHIRAFTKWTSIADFGGLHRIVMDELFLADAKELNVSEWPITILTAREDALHNELSKYQPLQRLCSQIYEMSMPDSEWDALQHAQKREVTDLISVFSLAGGSGKTTVALHIAQQLALQGERVLYLNFEDIPSSVWCIGESSAPTLSEFLYYLKSDMHTHRDAKLVWLGNEHPQWKFFYFQPQAQFHEINELKEEDVLSLLESIMRSGTFRYVILDLSSHLSTQTITCLAKSNRICWLLTDELQHLSKVESFLSFARQTGIQQQWNWLHRTEWVLNKHFGYFLNPEQIEQHSLAARLPYVNQWRTESSVQSVGSDHAFIETLKNWLRYRNSTEFEHVRK